MPTRIHIPHRVIEHIAIPIQALLILRPHRAAKLLLFLVAQGKPRPKLVFAAQLGHKARLMEIDRERPVRDAIHATSGVARDDQIRRDKPP